MIDEYGNEVPAPATLPDDRVYHSPFWPLLILMVALSISMGYQVLETYRIKSNAQMQVDNAASTVRRAEEVRAQLYSMAQDLLHTSQTDAAAAQIVKEAGIRQADTNAPAATPPDSSGDLNKANP